MYTENRARSARSRKNGARDENVLAKRADFFIFIYCFLGTFLAESVPMDLTELSGKVAERERLPFYTPLSMILESLTFVMYYNNSNPNSRGLVYSSKFINLQ